MANFLHRTTKQYLISVPQNELPEAVANYIEAPDLSAVAGFASKYWIITGDVVTLMDQAAKDAVDAALLTARYNSLANEIDRTDNILRASLLAILDEFNSHANKTNELLDAIDNASNLAGLKAAVAGITDYPQRNVSQLKTMIRNSLGS